MKPMRELPATIGGRWRQAGGIALFGPVAPGGLAVLRGQAPPAAVEQRHGFTVAADPAPAHRP
jgi:hypothetical protein